MIREVRDALADYLRSRITDGYPAAVERYQDQLLRIEESELALPAVLVRTSSGSFDVGKQYTHSLDLICIDLNEAGLKSQTEAVEALMDWTLENLPPNLSPDGNYTYYLTGEGRYRFVLVAEAGRQPLTIGIISLEIGAEA